jgi:hypothetical protein
MLFAEVKIFLFTDNVKGVIRFEALVFLFVGF